MSNVVLFQGMQAGDLAAFVNSPDMQAAMEAVDDDVQSFASFPSISIKGKVFTLVQGDDAKVMMRPDDPEEVAQSIQLVILRANDKARTYYDKQYSEQADAEKQKPTCYSMDGVTPSPNSITVQSNKCAVCPHAVFGTARKSDGTFGKGTACGSNARLAVAAADSLDKPHLLRAPATSLKPLRDAIEVIRKRKIPYPIVVMKISFVPEEASPLLKFVPIGLLDAASASKSVGMREDPVVRAICGLDERVRVPQTEAPAPAPAPATDDLGAGLDAAIAQRAAEAPAPTPVVSPAPPAPTPAPPPVVAAPPPPAPVPPAVPAAGNVTVATGDLLGELGALLGGLDG